MRDPNAGAANPIKDQQGEQLPPTSGTASARVGKEIEARPSAFQAPIANEIWFMRCRPMLG